MERMWKEAVMAYLRYHSGAFLGRPKKIIKPCQEKSASWLRFKLGISKIKAMNGTIRAIFLDTLEIYETTFFFW
jgi:hypothetical protein